MTIREQYDKHSKTKSDINEHLPTLFEYAQKNNHITEFGTRWGASTWAFLNAKPKTLISYDIQRTKYVDNIELCASKENINYHFYEADTLDIDIAQTDLLFIDTFHSYVQLISELKLHHNKVNRYIIAHDTNTYGQKDMPYVGPISVKIESLNKQYNKKKGLMNAIRDFILEHSEWQIKKIFKNNHGLTILEKQL